MLARRGNWASSGKLRPRRAVVLRPGRRALASATVGATVPQQASLPDTTTVFNAIDYSYSNTLVKTTLAHLSGLGRVVAPAGPAVALREQFRADVNMDRETWLYNNQGNAHRALVELLGLVVDARDRAGTPAPVAVVLRPFSPSDAMQLAHELQIRGYSVGMGVEAQKPTVSAMASLLRLALFARSKKAKKKPKISDSYAAMLEANYAQPLMAILDSIYDGQHLCSDVTDEKTLKERSEQWTNLFAHHFVPPGPKRSTPDLLSILRDLVDEKQQRRLRTRFINHSHFQKALKDDKPVGEHIFYSKALVSSVKAFLEDLEAMNSRLADLDARLKGMDLPAFKERLVQEKRSRSQEVTAIGLELVEYLRNRWETRPGLRGDLGAPLRQRLERIRTKTQQMESTTLDAEVKINRISVNEVLEAMLQLLHPNASIDPKSPPPSGSSDSAPLIRYLLQYAHSFPLLGSVVVVDDWLASGVESPVVTLDEDVQKNGTNSFKIWYITLRWPHRPPQLSAPTTARAEAMNSPFTLRQRTHRDRFGLAGVPFVWTFKYPPNKDLSFTAIRQFLHCPAQFAFKHLFNFTPSALLKLTTGSALHSAAATVHQTIVQAKEKLKKEKEEAEARGEPAPAVEAKVEALSSQTVSTIVEEAFVNQIKAEVKQENPEAAPQVLDALATQRLTQNKSRIDRLKLRFNAFSASESSMEMLNLNSVTNEKFRVKIGEGKEEFYIRGEIDRIETDSAGNVSIVELKTRIAHELSENGLDQTFQGLLYSLAYWKQHAVVPNRVVIRSLADSDKQGTERHGDRRPKERTFPVSQDHLLQIERFVAQVGAQMRSTTSFPATPKRSNCQGCGFAAHCPSVV